MARVEQPLSLDPADYDDVDIDDPENPELTDEDFARSRPFREAMGDEFTDLWQANRERYMAEREAEAKRVLPADVVDFYRGQGADWQARIAADLQDLVRIKRRVG